MPIDCLRPSWSPCRWPAFGAGLRRDRAGVCSARAWCGTPRVPLGGDGKRRHLDSWQIYELTGPRSQDLEGGLPPAGGRSAHLRPLHEESEEGSLGQDPDDGAWKCAGTAGGAATLDGRARVDHQPGSNRMHCPPLGAPPIRPAGATSEQEPQTWVMTRNLPAGAVNRSVQGRSMADWGRTSRASRSPARAYQRASPLRAVSMRDVPEKR